MFKINCEIDLEKVSLPRKKRDYTSCNTYLNDVNGSDMEERNVQNSWTFILNHIEHCVDNFIALKTDTTKLDGLLLCASS